MREDNFLFLGRPPGSLARYGIIIIMVLVVISMLLAGTIRYSDVVIANVEVSPIIRPYMMASPRDGQIESFLVGQAEEVSVEQPLAILKTSESYDDINTVKLCAIKGMTPDETENPFPKELGEIEPAFSAFIKALSSYRTAKKYFDITGDSIIQSQKHLSRGSSLEKTEIQLGRARRNLKLKRENLKRMTQLLEKGVISKQEMENIEIGYNTASQEVQRLMEMRHSSQYNLLDSENDLKKSNFEMNQTLNSIEIEFKTATLKVLSQISVWEEQNLIKSPIKGKLFFMDIRHPYELVKKGDHLMGVEPPGKGALVAMARFPAQNSGLVRKGQQVIIRLQNYPFQIWGTLEGKVSDVSSVPKNNGQTTYMAHVTISSRKTSANKEIPDNGKMFGIGEIMLERRSALNKIFFELKDKTYSN